MKIKQIYSHLNGLEWIMVHQKATWKEINRVVKDIDAETCRTKVCEEKGRHEGKLLYSPIDLNKCFERELEALGWSEVRTSYWVTDDVELIRKTMTLKAAEQKAIINESGRRPISSYNQTDFQKNRIAIEVQFGKYAFIAYDLFVKHMAFYVGDKIDVGIEILPMKSMQEEMSSGIGYYESSLYDVVRQGRGVPAVPLVLLGIVP